MRFLFSKYETRTFMTSLEIIREVMNVPMEAIHAIARMNGISTADDHEQNISESALQPFIEAFERKTRNYFVNSMRNRAQLTPQELQTFTEFCKTFKKGNVSLGNVSNWNHIGKTKLRECFVERIKEKTPSSKERIRPLDLFSGCGGFSAGFITFESKPLTPTFDKEEMVREILHPEFDYSHVCSEYSRVLSGNIIERITLTWCYQSQAIPIAQYEKPEEDIVRQVVRTARYYIYIDDDDDHHSDTVSINGHNDHIINSTCRMVA